SRRTNRRRRRRRRSRAMTSSSWSGTWSTSWSRKKPSGRAPATWATRQKRSANFQVSVIEGGGRKIAALRLLERGILAKVGDSLAAFENLLVSVTLPNAGEIAGGGLVVVVGPNSS